MCTPAVAGVADDGTVDAGRLGVLLVVSTLAYLAMAAYGASSGGQKAVGSRRCARPFAAVCCCAGTLTMAAGTWVVGGVWPATAVFVLGTCVFALGNALLVTMWGERWCTLATGKVGRCLYASYLVGILVCLVVGAAPLGVGVAVVAACPAFSVAVLVKAQKEPSREVPGPLPAAHPPLARPLVGAVLLNVVWGMGLPTVLAAVSSAEATAGARMTAGATTFLGLVTAFAILAVLVMYLVAVKPESESLALFKPAFVLLPAGFLLCLVDPWLASLGYGVATAGGACLDMLLMLVATDMAFATKRPVALTLGLAMGVSRSGTLAGQCAYSAFLAGTTAPIQSALAIYVLVVLLCVAGLCSQANLEALYRVEAVRQGSGCGGEKPGEPGCGGERGLLAVDEVCAAVEARCALTPREGQILRLLAHGRSAPFIADELCLSTGTVKNYVSGIYRKLGVSNRQNLLNLLEASRDEKARG
jgi:DNA-binding CsgD family transcriptional regulator